MYMLLLLATALFPLLMAVTIWRRTGDPLHVGVILAPLFSYAYGIRPWIQLFSVSMIDHFINLEELELVQAVYLAGIVALFLGLRAHSVRGNLSLTTQRLELMAQTAGPVMLRWAYVLGIIAVGSYAYALVETGGISTAFGQAKGGVRVASGYLGESPLLGFVASFLFAVVWAKRGLTLLRVLALAFPLVPFALQSILGGRRGPTFMVGMTLLVVMSLVSRKKLTLKKTAVGVSLILLAVVFAVSQRQRVYLGSEETVDLSRVVDFFVPETADTGDEYITGVTSFLATWYEQSYYWGRRYFVLFFVRPIPRQLWPGKYTFFGMEQLDEARGAVGAGDRYWLMQIGRRPPQGSSWGLITDLFQEVSWACIPFCYCLGWAMASLRRRALVHGGVWSFLYLECFPLLIYLPTQSFTSAAYRYLILAIPSILLMRRLSRKGLVRRLRPALAERRC